MTSGAVRDLILCLPAKGLDVPLHATVNIYGTDKFEVGKKKTSLPAEGSSELHILKTCYKTMGKKGITFTVCCVQAGDKLDIVRRLIKTY